MLVKIKSLEWFSRLAVFSWQLFSLQLAVVQLLWLMAYSLWPVCASGSVGGLLAHGLWLAAPEGAAFLPFA